MHASRLRSPSLAELQACVDGVRKQLEHSDDPATLLEQRQFRIEITPPELRAIYTLAGRAISTPGNLTSINSLVKTGKSAVIGAMMAAAMANGQAKDLLGFSSSNRMLYFPVSAKRKANADKKSRDGAVGKEELMRSLERSGFLKLPRFLNQGLLRQKEKQVAQETARHLLAGCASLERELADRQQIVLAASKEELERYARQFTESRQALVAWERTTYREEMQHFDDQFPDLKQAALTRLQNELDPTGPIVNQVIARLRSTEFNPEEVNVMAGQIQQECLGQASQAVTNTQAAFNQQALTLIGDTAGRLAKGFKMAEGDHPLQVAGTPAIKIEDTLHLQFSGFENLRTALYGGMAGSAIASVGLGLLTIIFPPAGAAAMLVTMLGAYLGGREAIKLQTQRKRQEATQALSNLLVQTVSKALNQARNQFTEAATLLQRKARETFQQATERARTESLF